VARNLDRLNEAKRELENDFDVQVEIMPADLTIPEISEDIIQELKKRNICIDILINNAGIGSMDPFVDQEWKTIQNMLQVNIVNLTHLTKLLLKGMVQRNSGKIVNVASTAAFQAGPFMAVYYATKAYVLIFSESIANELQGTGVTVTGLCPGPTESGFQATANQENARFLRMKKLPTAEQVARYGYQAMIKGQAVAVHGVTNKVFAFMTRILPRTMQARIVRSLHAKT